MHRIIAVIVFILFLPLMVYGYVYRKYSLWSWFEVKNIDHSLANGYSVGRFGTYMITDAGKVLITKNICLQFIAGCLNKPYTFCEKMWRYRHWAKTTGQQFFWWE